jgi:hypothetical protein
MTRSPGPDGGPPAGDAVAGQRFSEALAASGWSPEAFARHLNAFAQANGVNRAITEKTPYKWRRGVRPNQPWPALVAALLSARTDTEVTPEALGWAGAPIAMYVPANDGLVQPWTPAGSLRAALDVANPGGMLDRRKFLTVAGAALTGPAHEWLVSGPPGGGWAVAEPPDRSGSGRIEIGDALVDQLETITGQLRQMDDSIGGIPVLGLARAHVSHVTGLLANGRYTDQVGRRLHAVLAEVLRLCGWLSFDASRHPDAQRYFFTALRAARTAGDDPLGANIIAFMSCQAKELGQVREAVTLAATAAAGHPHATGRTRAIFALRHAEASAHAADAAAVRRHVEDAFDHLSDPSTGEPDWCYWMNQTQAHGQAGYAYLVLGDNARAQHHLRAAAPAEDAVGREAVLRSALLATAYAGPAAPDLDLALAAGNTALRALTGSVDSPRCAGYLADFVVALAPYRQRPAVREFSDRVRAELPARGPGS